MHRRRLGAARGKRDSIARPMRGKGRHAVRSPVQKKVRELQRLVPGGRQLPAAQLFLHTADYIFQLRLKVQLLLEGDQQNCSKEASVALVSKGQVMDGLLTKRRKRTNGPQLLHEKPNGFVFTVETPCKFTAKPALKTSPADIFILNQ
ncbi:hypothetical protein C4D60_Mb05t12490 [Musa balbisiana]|uniref:BHLH domain-containing protein n=1 Tax=Musa balbisiana TaxID=52838 RepID=A0A4S8JVN1_MUSBA|nr:hypothetical protein C4D60_Mb05t12490 [Musa balbisiana]